MAEGDSGVPDRTPEPDWKARCLAAEGKLEEAIRERDEALAERDRWHKAAMDAGTIVHSDGSLSFAAKARTDSLQSRLDGLEGALRKGGLHWDEGDDLPRAIGDLFVIWRQAADDLEEAEEHLDALLEAAGPVLQVCVRVGETTREDVDAINRLRAAVSAAEGG